MKNPKFTPPYWDEMNKNLVKWWKKGKWKKILRKRWIKQRIKDGE